MRFLISFILLVQFSIPARAQQQIIEVDGLGIVPLSYASITLGMAASSPGDTVRIWGMTSGGLPLAYSNGNTSETFPLEVKAGVTVVGAGDPVLIWPDLGAIPAEVFLLKPSGSNTTTLAQLSIGGGSTGVRMDDVGASAYEFNSVTFSGSTTSLSAVQTLAGKTSITMDDCRIVDIVTAGTFQQPSIGLLFNALETTQGQIPNLEVNVNSMTTSGSFSNNLGIGYPANLYLDLEAVNNGKSSRLIHVFASGITQEHPNGIGGTPNDIAEVILNVNGGILDAGGDTAGDGWDIGIYSGLYSGSTHSDYACGTTVTVTGAVLDGFNLAGIYSTANTHTRGLTQLRGQTTVKNTGHLSDHTLGGDTGSGVHMFCLEGYLGLTAADTNIIENTGNGIFLNCIGTSSNLIEHLEVGLYLGLLRTKIHKNDGNGLEMKAGVPNPNGGFAQQSIVGGTWSQDPQAVTQLHSGAPRALLPTGQGVVANSAISNNGENGVLVESRGERGETIVFCRFSNTFIWHNALRGFSGHFSLDTPQQPGSLGTILTPLLQCTIVGNGAWNIEFDRDNSSNPLFGWEDLLTSQIAFVTEIANSVFQRVSSNDPDFGPFLHSVSVNTVQSTLSAPDKVAVGGVRAKLLPGPPLIGTFEQSTDVNVAFAAGSINWTSWNATQFFLGSSVNPLLLVTPGWINTVGPETAQDYSGDPRPAIQTLWDKGGEEL